MQLNPGLPKMAVEQQACLQATREQWRPSSLAAAAQVVVLLLVTGDCPSWALQCRTNMSEFESYTAALRNNPGLLPVRKSLRSDGPLAFSCGLLGHRAACSPACSAAALRRLRRPPAASAAARGHCRATPGRGVGTSSGRACDSPRSIWRRAHVVSCTQCHLAPAHWSMLSDNGSLPLRILHLAPYSKEW